MATASNKNGTKAPVKNGAVTGKAATPSGHGVIHPGRTGPKNGNGNGDNGNSPYNMPPKSIGNSRVSGNSTRSSTSPYGDVRAPSSPRGEPTNSPPKQWWESVRSDPRQTAAYWHQMASAIWSPDDEQQYQDGRAAARNGRNGNGATGRGTTRQPTNGRSSANSNGAPKAKAPASKTTRSR